MIFAKINSSKLRRMHRIDGRQAVRPASPGLIQSVSIAWLNFGLHRFGQAIDVLRFSYHHHLPELFYSKHTLAREFILLGANFHSHISKASLGKHWGEISAEIQSA